MDYFKIITLNNKRLAVYKTGEIVFWDTDSNKRFKNGWNFHKGGKKNNYKNYIINGKNYYHHRILAYCFLGLDINDKTQFIDHINHDTIDNNLKNLRIVTNQQNQWNQKNTKGFHKTKYGKFRSSLTFNDKTVYIGTFDTEEEAHQAYLDAKQKYHSLDLL